MENGNEKGISKKLCGFVPLCEKNEFEILTGRFAEPASAGR
ncbi:MAG: hypothetical protein AAB893_04495 [Patescibacteria group bacterium]